MTTTAEQNSGNILEQWQDYLVARKAGIKPRWKRLLNQHLAQINALNSTELQTHLDQLCVAYFDLGETRLPLQHPVIWQKIQPIWIHEIEQENPIYLLWAYQAAKAAFPPVSKLLAQQHDCILLEKILTHQPEHRVARSLLLIDYLDSLDFALHELPFGLLFKVSVCEQLMVSCDQLIETMPDLVNETSRFNLRLDHYKRVFYGWLDYQSSGSQDDFFTWLAARS